MFLKDASKPEGEACNPDGTLKDADKIEWLNSPSDEAAPAAPAAPLPSENPSKHAVHVYDDVDESDDKRVTKRRRVS